MIWSKFIPNVLGFAINLFAIIFQISCFMVGRWDSGIIIIINFPCLILFTVRLYYDVKEV